MKQLSAKKTERMAAYYEQRTVYLLDYPYCGFPGCQDRAREVHHKRGRVGKRLLDESTWVGVCMWHHLWIHDHPAKAREMGLKETK